VSKLKKLDDAGGEGDPAASATARVSRGQVSTSYWWEYWWECRRCNISK